MSTISNLPIWQLHIDIENARYRYCKLKLAHPNASAMAESGKNHPAGPSPASEAENQGWRMLIRAYGALIGEIYYMSAAAQGDRFLADGLPQFSPHAELAIGEIVRENWRSLSRFAPLIFSEPALELYVANLIDRLATHDADLNSRYSQAEESANA